MLAVNTKKISGLNRLKCSFILVLEHISIQNENTHSIT